MYRIFILLIVVVLSCDGSDHAALAAIAQTELSVSVNVVEPAHHLYPKNLVPDTQNIKHSLQNAPGNEAQPLRMQDVNSQDQFGYSWVENPSK